MIKLNKHGLTAIEVLISFTIVSVIVVTLFKVINNFKEKQYMESSKNLVETLRSSITVTIQDDLLLHGGIKSVDQNKDSEPYGITEIKITFQDDTEGLFQVRKSDEDYDGEEYIYYKSDKTEDKFSLNDIPGVLLNECKVDVDVDKGLLAIYIGVVTIDIADRYCLLDLTVPLTEKWTNAYKSSST